MIIMKIFFKVWKTTLGQHVHCTCEGERGKGMVTETSVEKNNNKQTNKQNPDEIYRQALK